MQLEKGISKTGAAIERAVTYNRVNVSLCINRKPCGTLPDAATVACLQTIPFVFPMRSSIHSSGRIKCTKQLQCMGIESHNPSMFRCSAAQFQTHPSPIDHPIDQG